MQGNGAFEISVPNCIIASFGHSSFLERCRRANAVGRHSGSWVHRMELIVQRARGDSKTTLHGKASDNEEHHVDTAPYHRQPSRHPEVACLVHCAETGGQTVSYHSICLRRCFYISTYTSPTMLPARSPSRAAMKLYTNGMIHITVQLRHCVIIAHAATVKCVAA